VRGAVAIVAVALAGLTGCLDLPAPGGGTPAADAASRDAQGGDDGDDLPSDGLLAHYPLDEIAAVGSPDVVGQFHAGCQSECPTSVPAVRGGGLLFAEGRHLVVPDVPELRLASGTVAVWARPDELGRYTGLVLKPIGTGTAKSWEIYLDNTDRPVFQSDNANSIRGPTPLRAGTWIHLAITWDASSRRLFVGGDLAGSVTASLSPDYDGEAMRFGTGVDNQVPVNAFLGALDDVRIYDRPLETFEIALLATPP
jgi:hypothetical protein